MIKRKAYTCTIALHHISKSQLILYPTLKEQNDCSFECWDDTCEPVEVYVITRKELDQMAKKKIPKKKTVKKNK